MHAILTALGSKGDVYPIIAFGRALHERGHRVTTISAGPFEQDVRSAGLEYAELCGTAQYEEMTHALMRRGDLGLRPLTPEERLAISQLWRLAPAGIYRLIEEAHTPGDTVVCMTEAFSLGAGSLAKEKLGTPYVSLWHIMGMLRLIAPIFPHALPIEERLRGLIMRCIWESNEARKAYLAFRGELGLPVGSDWVHRFFYTQDLNVCLFPRWITPWLRRQMPNMVLTDFPFYLPDEDAPLAPELERFLAAGEAPVVFTNASWRDNATSYYDASVRACQKLGLRGILLGWRTRPALPDDETVFAAEFASFATLLPRAAAVVHHGGLGTMAWALKAGVPQLVVPKETDQPFNAKIVEHLGVGRKVKPAQYERRIAPLLRELLASTAVRGAVADVNARFDTQPRLDAGLKAIEALLEPRAATASSQPTHLTAAQGR